MRAHGILAFTFAAAAMLLSYRGVLERRSRFPPEDDILYLPRVGALKVMSLGHHELTATMVFVRATVYFGGELASKDKKFTWLDNYLDTIISLDPQFELAYRWAGSATMYNGQQITNEAVQRANRFLGRGVEHFPKSWQLPWMIGCNYLFELKTEDPKQKAEWERIGGDWIRRAALVGSAPSWAGLLAAQIMRKSGRDEAAIRYLEEVYATTTDEETRKEIRNRIVSMRSALEVEQLDRSAREFAEGHRQTVPYGHPDLYVLLGKRRSPRLDPEFLAQDEVLLEAQRSEENMRKERGREE